METVTSPAEQRVVLHNIGWNTYERLLADHENNSAPRLTYDRGELEIMSPSPEHEKFNRRIAQLVLAVAEELNIEAEDLGSTTFRRETWSVASSLTPASTSRTRSRFVARTA
jgi:Uma2 family endonuclease